MGGTVGRRSLGCALGAFTGVIIVALLAFWIYNEAASQQRRAVLRAMPPGWMTLIRQRATVPASVIALEPARSIDDNGAFAVYDTALGVWTLFQMDSVFARVTERRPLLQDSFTVREVVADRALDRWLFWADHAWWNALELILLRSDSAAADDLLRVRVPDYAVIRSAASALALRGWARAEYGNFPGAERDLRAALGLGAMLARREPTLAGFLAGRAAIHAAAHGLQHLAELSENGALANLAADASAWSAPSAAQDYEVLAVAPDSALALALDTTIAIGWRAEALHAFVRAAMAKPSARVFGFPGSAQRRLDSIAAASRGEFGRLARLAAGSGRVIDAMGIAARMERFGN